MSSDLLRYYEAIEKASVDMLTAAQAGNWDQVLKLEGACVLLINQLKQAARNQPLNPEEAALKTAIMQRILIRDAEIRQLAEPWLNEFNRAISGESRSLH